MIKKKIEKISRRIYNGFPIRAVWNEKNDEWYFSILDIIAALRDESDYSKCRNYWKYLKNKFKKGKNQVVSGTTQLKLPAPDGKMRLADTISVSGIKELINSFPSKVSSDFILWFNRDRDSIDAKSKEKAYKLFDDGIIDKIEIGTIKGLKQIHSYLFSGLYDFAGKIRKKNISKGGFKFANVLYLDDTLKTIEKMPENTVKQIVEKYVEMNVAHPFMEGNGRSTRIWLDLMLKRSQKKCVDWSKIDKNKYLDAMKESPSIDTKIQNLIKKSLTKSIKSREMFMKGIDYSYYYEEV